VTIARDKDVVAGTMKKITKIVGAVGTKLRDRSRSAKLRLLEIGRIARAKGSLNRDRLRQRYRRLLDTTSQVVGQAKRFSKETSTGVKRSSNVLKQLALEGLRAELDRMVPLVRRVMRQARARTFHGNTHVKARFSACSSRPPKSFAKAPFGVWSKSRILCHWVNVFSALEAV
jgi:IS5 family transposase